MKFNIKLAALALAFVMLSCLFCGCSNYGTAVMQLGDTEITAPMIQFWLSRYKAQFVYYYGDAICAQYGISDIEKFWSIKSDSASGETYDDVLSGYIYDNAETYLCALYLFDKYDLKLPDSSVKEVDDYMDTLLEEYAFGSKSEFNAVLSPYGINYNILRELYLIDEKVDYLQEYLFGKYGTIGITNIDREEYYRENYVRMRQICFFINERPVIDENGLFVTDDKGYTKYEDMSATETQEARDRCAEALAKINAGESFSSVLSKYDENTADDGYTGGIYMSEYSALGTDESLEEIFVELRGMKEGEIKVIETENNLHIVEKMPLNEGAYNEQVNSDFFTFYDSELGTYVTYDQYLKTPLFLEYIEETLVELSADIKIDDELLKKYKLSTVTANYYF